MLALHPAGAVLAAHGVREDIILGDGPDGMQHVGLLVADLVGLEGHHRLHRHHAHELQQVVLHHVAQGAGLLVIAAAMLDADLLRDGDLHVVDVAPVPDRLEDGVGEAEGQDVLHRLLAQVVIDAVDLRLAIDPGQGLGQGAGRGQVMPEGLLDHDPRVLRGPLPDRPCRAPGRS